MNLPKIKNRKKLINQSFVNYKLKFLSSKSILYYYNVKSKISITKILAKKYKRQA